MTIKQIYELALLKGLAADPRGQDRIARILKKEKEKFHKLDPEEQKRFDQERLKHPFSDTRILHGEPATKVERILAGIDIGVGELLLADKLAEKGEKIDLILSHHPLGKALARLDDVMKLQADLCAQFGVPVNIAESLLEIRMDEVSRTVAPINHNQVVDAARLLNLPLMCVHTVTDNLVFRFISGALRSQEKDFEYVSDVLAWLNSIPEYQAAHQIGSGPRLLIGKEGRRAGKIVASEVTGGTEGSKGMYEQLARAGIGTIIGMHMKEENKQEAEKYHLNVIIAGHIASDSLGMNLLFDDLEKRGVEIAPCSGLIRVRRWKKKRPKKK